MFSRGSISILVAFATAVGVALADPTNAEINQAESGNPESPNYGNRVISGTGNANAVWEESEAGNPDSARPGKRERRVHPDSFEAAQCSTRGQCKEQRTK
jgi:hypothetical protein